jgi:DNA-binding transcriptional ArsR family regulator
MLGDSAVLTAIASPRRREILRLVWTEEMAAGAIHLAMPDITFGAVSLQLRTLLEAGLIESRAEGRHRLYRANREAVGPVGRMLEEMWNDSLWRLKLQAELAETRRGPQPKKADDSSNLKADDPSNRRSERERGLAGRGGGAPRQTKKR